MEKVSTPLVLIAGSAHLQKQPQTCISYNCPAALTSPGRNFLPTPPFRFFSAVQCLRRFLHAQPFQIAPSTSGPAFDLTIPEPSIFPSTIPWHVHCRVARFTFSWGLSFKHYIIIKRPLMQWRIHSRFYDSELPRPWCSKSHPNFNLSSTIMLYSWNRVLLVIQ